MQIIFKKLLGVEIDLLGAGLDNFLFCLGCLWSCETMGKGCLKQKICTN
jgi:hypothetical protein